MQPSPAGLWIGAETPICPPVHPAWASTGSRLGTQGRGAQPEDPRQSSGTLVLHLHPSCLPEARILPLGPSLAPSTNGFHPLPLPGLIWGYLLSIKPSRFSQALGSLVPSREVSLHLEGSECTGYVCSWSPACNTVWHLVGGQTDGGWFLYFTVSSFGFRGLRM